MALIKPHEREWLRGPDGSALREFCEGAAVGAVCVLMPILIIVGFTVN